MMAKVWGAGGSGADAPVPTAGSVRLDTARMGRYSDGEQHQTTVWTPRAASRYWLPVRTATSFPPQLFNGVVTGGDTVTAKQTGTVRSRSGMP
jgi:hypothetical protein